MTGKLHSYKGSAKQIVYWLSKTDFVATEGKDEYMWEVTERLQETGIHIKYEPRGFEAFLQQLAENDLLEMKEI